MPESDDSTRHERGDPPPQAPQSWERETLARLAAAGLAEQRRGRRWGVLFKSLVLLYLFVVLFAILNLGSLLEPPGGAIGPHTAVVDIQGLIAPGSPASASRVIEGLEAAFADPRTQGVILRINSPGGSPVQAGMIYDAIRRLREAHPDIPVYAVAMDLCASGAYYVAAAADRIYANRASLVGSIGVLLSGFGFAEVMDNLGVKRRMITAGEHKAMLDPFLPLRPEEVEHLQRMVEEIHAQFIHAVKVGRGERLATESDAELFSGLIWTGTKALELGLVDGLASPAYVAREVIGAPRMVNFTPRLPWYERVSRRIGAAFAGVLKTEVLSPRLW